ncbi:polyprenol monophosphomannose synthase [Actinotalea sp. BY-33]|uniref:Polyprenol monophosphomannose synthase n=1 Tax=Actinotalea soli TaxID=2819234 RepID=A0A939LPZ2_9CELL|nr:polyprenol monophosphomannose synthase [Actinotalea soli]MBO1750405.1 polyprenol monophosphomannose synthase [Actinotalea soli]
MRAEPSATGGRAVAPRVLVVIPTYDEATTLPGTLGRLRLAVPAADVLVVDDASPDGTGRIADDLATEDPQVQVLHRTGKHGLGSAYVEGFGWGLTRGYEVLVEMDADGSHQPEDLPRLLSALAADDLHGPDLVLGSRWTPGGSVENWPRRRVLLSRGGNSFTRLVLGLPLRDATAGFRAYRASALRALPLDEVASQGYCFQVDMAWRVVRHGGEVREVPIRFVERTQGLSKMSRQIVLEAFWRVCVWGVQHRWAQLRRTTTTAARGRRP